MQYAINILGLHLKELNEPSDEEDDMAGAVLHARKTHEIKNAIKILTAINGLK